MSWTRVIAQCCDRELNPYSRFGMSVMVNRLSVHLNWWSNWLWNQVFQEKTKHYHHHNGSEVFVIVARPVWRTSLMEGCILRSVGHTFYSWSLMNHYSYGLNIGHANWYSQELGWDWSPVTLTYFPRSKATIVDFCFWMITYESLQLRFRYQTCWLVWLRALLDWLSVIFTYFLRS